MALSRKTAERSLRATLEKAQPKRIVLHAGRIKTGSTFLQSALIHNAETLARSGWLFPQSLLHFGNFQTESRGLRTSGHAILARLAAAHSVYPGSLGRFDAEMAQNTDRLLFSTEILGRDPRESLLVGLAPVLDGFDVEIVIYLRRPSVWIESYYIEKVTGSILRADQLFRTCLDDLRTAAGAAGFVDQIGTWNNEPQLTFRNYDLSQECEGGLLADFCQTIGLPMLPEPARSGINNSPSFAVARAIRVFNALTRGVPGERYKTLYAELLERLAPLDDGQRGWFLAPDEAAEIDADWARGNTALVEGGHISQQDYDALTAPTDRKPLPPYNPAVEARLLSEVCKFLQESGITGFEMPPTVAGVSGELRRRIGEALRRRLRRTLTK